MVVEFIVVQPGDVDAVDGALGQVPCRVPDGVVDLVAVGVIAGGFVSLDDSVSGIGVGVIPDL